MEHLHLTEKAIFPDMTIWKEKYNEPIEKIRVGCRGIVLDQDKILLSYEAKNDWYFICGGGLEEGETLVQGCIREVSEETGILVEPIRFLVTADGYYHERIFRNHFFLCRPVGEVSQNLTQQETENHMIPRWVPTEKAIRIFSEYRKYEQSYDMLSESYFRDYRILTEILPQVQKQFLFTEPQQMNTKEIL